MPRPIADAIVTFEGDSVLLMFRQIDGSEGLLTMTVDPAMSVMRQAIRRRAQQEAPEVLPPEPHDELRACDAYPAGVPEQSSCVFGQSFLAKSEYESQILK